MWSGNKESTNWMDFDISSKTLWICLNERCMEELISVNFSAQICFFFQYVHFYSCCQSLYSFLHSSINFLYIYWTPTKLGTVGLALIKKISLSLWSSQSTGWNWGESNKNVRSNSITRTKGKNMWSGHRKKVPK